MRHYILMLLGVCAGFGLGFAFIGLALHDGMWFWGGLLLGALCAGLAHEGNDNA